MISIIALLVASTLVSAGEAPAAPLTGNSKKALERFVREAPVRGNPNRVPGAIGKLIDVAPDTPAYIIVVSTAQSSDQMSHVFHLMIEPSDTGKQDPIGLVLLAKERGVEIRESHYFRASLDGKLLKVGVVRVRIDDTKTPASTSEAEVTSSDIKNRFQHELDLWLKKSYLKKEWRDAEFSGGVLTKKASRR